MTKTRLIRLFITIIIGVAIAGAIAAYQVKNETAKTIKSSVVAKNFGGDFTLTNHLGENVTNKDFENDYRLIYFGFTYCPAICPTELQRISQILKKLGENGETIQPIFITVDPERDTVDVMKNYISLFDPRLIGLTGTVAQIENIKKAYKIYAAKVQEDGMNDYTVDHSSFIYFMGPNDTLIRIFKTGDTVEDMTNIIHRYINKS